MSLFKRDTHAKVTIGDLTIEVSGYTEQETPRLIASALRLAGKWQTGDFIDSDMRKAWQDAKETYDRIPDVLKGSHDRA